MMKMRRYWLNKPKLPVHPVGIMSFDYLVAYQRCCYAEDLPIPMIDNGTGLVSKLVVWLPLNLEQFTNWIIVKCMLLISVIDRTDDVIGKEGSNYT